MKDRFRGFSKVFSFTFKNHVGKKGYKAATILIALLCLLIPALTMTGIEFFSQGELSSPEQAMPAPPDAIYEERDEPDMSQLKKIFVVNKTDFKYDIIDESALPGVKFKEYGEDFEAARKDSAGTSDTLILIKEAQGTYLKLNVLIPENSGIDENVASQAEIIISAEGQSAVEKINMEKGWGQIGDEGTIGSRSEIGADIDSADGADGAVGEHGDTIKSPMDSVKGILGFVLPYLNIMILYFFVLIYGQGVAQSAVMEKSSKLMDVFLLSVEPAAMMLGKVSAICLAGVIQLSLWIGSIIGGFMLGTAGAKWINPETDNIVVMLIDMAGDMTRGIFSVGGIVLALMIMIAGMLMYCSLAGIGGAFAGKSEDLSTTNIAFVLIIIASFFTCLLAGGLEGMENSSPWLDYIPFTAIMVTPSRVMLGSVSIAKGIVCLAIVLLSALFFTALAGRIYQIMALYKGELPKPKQIINMLKNS